ncbi:MAG: SPASM domain-containing protein [Chloroflexi bacterium]|uniref:SPASM domain-containing protein n=1 Tax=Candidatus Chlorohelix allophototropha TaxID=3003348 RepID=A0A8T7MAJ7_9CHLR|nr:SPASM domain-containing protein [Chloroflexota bacterium]WJW70337.1 SPASM domain-containing protein [Chloroflexota bacterium L227-S17]
METYVIPMSESTDSDKYIIFRPLTGLAFVGNRAMAELSTVLSKGAPVLPEQEVGEFLEAIDFYKPDPPTLSFSDTVFHPTTAVLLMTNRCQLRCIYCYASSGEFSPKDLSSALGYTAIDYACQNAQEMGRSEFEVSFHGGGEPTLAWKTIQECTAYAREKPIKAKISLTSNGIWSSAQLDWITSNLDGLTLSIDGGSSTQGRQRPLSSGGNSSALVMSTAKELDGRNFNYGIRMTATEPWSNLPEDVRFLVEETRCPTIQVEPAFNPRRGGHGQPDEMEALAFAEAFLEAIEVANQSNRILFYSGARLGMSPGTFCTAPYGALIVNAEGELVSCYEVTNATHPMAKLSAIGRIAGEEVIVDQAARSYLLNLIAERREACRDCFIYWSCAGGCYSRMFGTGPEGHQIREGRCYLNRYITQQLLLKGIADGNGVLYSPPRSGCNC